ncbi:cupin domain-containing protein [Pararhodobacter marinus]|uniref:Cupin domain-containing protein n=1 Tax=Pararhodobacter marinus TaxID=2184063 RepID=A0A2U2C7H3_9RHOB|nr:cupin domain-containing protein [Pararhodobacter marinus]PWE27830.1 cupin domain-containing protein [Pararhodobacter marinus]
MNPIHWSEAPHYLWAGDCEGWRLCDTPELSVIHERMPAGRSETAHRHAHARQVFRCLSGQLRIATPDTIHTLSEGQSLEIPPGTWHRAHCETETTFLVISAPSTRGDREDAAGMTR